MRMEEQQKHLIVELRRLLKQANREYADLTEVINNAAIEAGVSNQTPGPEMVSPSTLVKDLRDMAQIGMKLGSAPLPTVIAEVNGGVINRICSNRGVQVIVLDQDTDGIPDEDLSEVNGEVVYVSSFELLSPAERGSTGIDPAFVMATLAQIEEIEEVDTQSVLVTAIYNGDTVMTRIRFSDTLTDGLTWQDENGFTVQVDDIRELAHVETRPYSMPSLGIAAPLVG